MFHFLFVSLWLYILTPLNNYNVIKFIIKAYNVPAAYMIIYFQVTNVEINASFKLDILELALYFVSHLLYSIPDKIMTVPKRPDVWGDWRWQDWAATPGTDTLIICQLLDTRLSSVILGLITPTPLDKLLVPHDQKKIRMLKMWNICCVWLNYSDNISLAKVEMVLFWSQKIMRLSELIRV